MAIDINVSGQRLSYRNSINNPVAGSYNFIPFVFHFDDTWSQIAVKKAHFVQVDPTETEGDGKKVIEVTLDNENQVYLPNELVPGLVELCLYGCTVDNEAKITKIATTNALNFSIVKNVHDLEESATLPAIIQDTNNQVSIIQEAGDKVRALYNKFENIIVDSETSTLPHPSEPEVTVEFEPNLDNDDNPKFSFQFQVPASYTLPPASGQQLGGVKIGNHINVDSEGRISTHAPYSLPTASDVIKGGVKVGDGLSITGDGVLSADAQEIPMASSSELGGVKIGDGLRIDDNGTLSADAQEIPMASSSELGGVKIGDGLHIDDNGVLSVDVQAGSSGSSGSSGDIPIATDSTLGGVKVGDGLSIASDGVLSADIEIDTDNMYILYESVYNCSILQDLDVDVIFPSSFTESYRVVRIDDYIGYGFGIVTNTYQNNYSFFALKVDENNYVLESQDLTNNVVKSNSRPPSEKERMGYQNAYCKYVKISTDLASSLSSFGYTYIGYKIPESYNDNDMEIIVYDTNITPDVYSKVFPKIMKSGTNYYNIGDWVFQALMQSPVFDVITYFTTDSNGNLYYDGKKVMFEQ